MSSYGGAVQDHLSGTTVGGVRSGSEHGNMDLIMCLYTLFIALLEIWQHFPLYYHNTEDSIGDSSTNTRTNTEIVIY